MTAAALPQQNPALAHAQAGLRLQQSGDCGGAIAEYHSALALGPELAPAWTNLGVCLAQQGRYQPAIAAYRKALALDAGQAPARFNLAMAEYKTEQWNAAAADLGQFLAVRPGEPRASLLLADCYLRLGENTKAIETAVPLEAALRAGDARALPAGANLALDYVLGTAYIRHGDLTEGEALIDQIMRRGDTPEVHLMLGEAYFERREFPKARQEFAAAVALNPILPGAQLRLGVANLFGGEPDAALQAFTAEFQQDPNNFETNFYLGYLAKQRDDLTAAERYLRRAAELRPDAYQPNFQLAVVAYQQNNLAEARRRLERAVQQSPDAVDAHVILGRVYYRLNMHAAGAREQALVRQLNAKAQAQSIAERLRDNQTPLPAAGARQR